MKTGGGQAGTSTPASDRQNPQLSSGTAGPVEDPEQNTLRAQIPAQVRPQNRLAFLCGAGQVGGVRAGCGLLRPGLVPAGSGLLETAVMDIMGCRLLVQHFCSII